MNLFEATKLLQSVGYTVAEDPAWAKFDRICESVMARIPGKLMLNEMGRAAGFRKKYGDEDSVALKVIKDIDSIDSAQSNYKNGKRTSTSIADKPGKTTEYYEDFEALKSLIEDEGNEDPDNKEAYNLMMRYYDAVENDDLTLIKAAAGTHGAKDGMDFNTAVAQGDIKRAIHCLKNSRRSGGGERAIASMKDKLATIMQMDGAEAYETELAALDSAINGLTAGSRGSRNSDTYVVDPNGKPVVSITRYLQLANIPFTENEDGTVTFTATPTKAAGILSNAERRGWSVSKQERERRPVSTKTSTTIYIDGTEDDYADVADYVLSKKKDITFTEGDNLSYVLTGTPNKIADAIESIKNIGIEVMVDKGEAGEEA